LLVKIVKEGEKSKKKMEKLRLGVCLGGQTHLICWFLYILTNQIRLL